MSVSVQRVVSAIRTLKKRTVPFISRENLLKSSNVILKIFFDRVKPTASIRKLLNERSIRYMDLGGFLPVEDYLIIHLVQNEWYGLPAVRNDSFTIELDRATNQPASLRRILLPKPSVCINFDIGRGLPLDDGALLGINMSHILEHFPRDQGLDILRECRRVLKPGGTLRISCPDLLRFARAYVGRDLSFYDDPSIAKSCMYKGLTALGDRFISKAYDNHNGHKWFYDAESTSRLLEEADFLNIRECALHDSKLPSISTIEPAYRAKESFYVEAVK